MSRSKLNLNIVVSLIAMTLMGGTSHAADTVSKEEGADAAAELSENDTILVTGRRQLMSGKTDTPIIETPQNIQILSGALLKDQGVVILDDALRNVAGVMPGGYYNGYDYYRIRGFDSSNSTYLDGLLFFNGVSQSTEISGLDRVEIAKGPPSSLYGQASLGGVVNLVSKRPTEEFMASVEATWGTHDFYDGQVDIGGRVTADGALALRLNAIYRHTGSFVDYADGARRIYIAPSATWRIGDRTTLTALFKYQNDRSELAPPLPALGTVLPNPNGVISHKLYVGDANNPGTIKQWRAHEGYEFVHEFSNAIRFRQNFRATQGKQYWRNLLYPAFLLEDDRTLVRYPYELNSHEKNIAVDSAIDAKFSALNFENAITFGVDYRWNSTRRRNWQINYSNPASYSHLDIFDPIYTDFKPNFVRTSARQESVKALGFYFQDSAKLFDQFTITIGARYDTSTSASNGHSSKDHALTPRFGLTWEVASGVYAYGSYSESFTPQVGFDGATGQQLDPERGKQTEFGLKTSLLGGRLNSTISIYDLKRSNVAIDDPTAPGAYIGAGNQRARGFEFDSQLAITDNLEVLAAYSYVDAENSQDQTIDGDVIAKGARLQNVPRHSLSGWVRYRFTEGPLEGFALSLGGNHYSSQSGDIPDTFSLPSYSLVNANIAYRKGPFRAQLNVRNLLDETYYTGSYNQVYVLPGRPRTFQLTLGWSY